MKERYLVYVKIKDYSHLLKGVVPELYFNNKEEAVKAAKNFWKNNDVEKYFIRRVLLDEYEEITIDN